MKFELNGPLQALLWKRYKYRTRKCHILLLEMFSAIIVFAILVMMKQMIINLKKQKEQKGKIIKVIYTPENYMAGAIMNPICSGHILGPEIECFSFNNDKTLQTFLEINNNSVTVLNFTNLKTETYPDQLEYTVQFKPPQEHTQKSTDFLLFHEEVDTPEYLPFLANLQWTINKGYLEKAFGEQVEHTIELKEITQKVSTDTALHAYLTLCSVIAPITFFLFTLSNMDYDKKTGLIAQMQFVGVSYNAVKISYIVDTIVFAMIYSIMITLFLKFMPPPVLLYSNAFLIIITFILHFLTITVLAFLCAAVSQPFQYAESLSLIIYVFLFWINKLLYERAIKEFIGRIFLYLLVPHSVICAFWYDVASLEDKGIGLQVKHLVEQEDTNHLLISLVWLFMFGHIIIGLAIAWYLDKVMPGRFGIALPLTFIFNKRYWFKAKRRRGVNFHVTAEKKTQLQDNRFFEHPPSKKTKVAIKIAKVSKEFKSLGRSPVLALDFVNLDVYKGEITVILGINGAGKTTLLSIITGMYEATKGNVYINGMDVNTRFHDLQKDLAYCPQKSVVFDFLTVRENIMFFQTVRGERANKRSNAQHIIGTLKMSEFADYYSHELSAGMKRCLQVACTLVCDADVIVLDEPTAGMDRQMRHDVWDVLLGLRKEKTILFTTTVLDEADALGDRIALLNQGKIKCHGSPIFLKKAIGADFILTVRLDEEITEGKEAPMKIRDAITAAGVTGEHTSKFMLSKSQASRVCLHLPAGERMLFPKVFDVLEERRRELGIACMDVGVSLEQVFLRFVEEDNIDYISAIQADTEMDDDVERLRGCHLWCQQYRILTMRAFQFVWARRCQFIFLQILIPFFALILITSTTNNAPVTMDDEVLALKGNTLVLYEPVGYRRKDVFNPLLYRFPKVIFSTSEDVRKDISQVLESKDRQFHTYGYKMNGSRTEIYHHPFASYAGISNAINIFSNMYMSLNMPYALRNHINTTVLQATMLQSSKALTKPKLVMHILSWSMWIAFLAIIPVAPLILLCIEEYYSGTRFNHLLIGCPPSIIWISKLTAHMIIYVAIVPPTVIVAAALMDNDSTINQWDYLIATFVLLTVYGPAFLIHWYVFSFAMNERYPITIIYIVSLYVALIVPTFVRILNKVMQFHKYASDIIIISYVFFNFSPIFTFSIGLGRISFTARNNALCKLNFHLCPNDFKGNEFVTVAKCCNSQDATPFKYFDALETGLLELCLLFVQIGVYWTLLLLLQCRKIQMVKEVVMKKVLKQPLKRYEDLNVRDEEIYVHEQMEQIRLMSIEERQTEADTILVDNLCKQYNLIIGKRCLAVNGVSFSVEKGECLGILGRSGAGKTSLLNMVAGFITSTAGRSVVNGYFLHEERRKYLKEICLATSGGVDEFLTGYRNLEIAAALRGYDYGHSEKMAIRYLQYMGLVTYSNVLSRNYSAGCLQRLRVCNTLIGKPHAAFFDEPCSSVDPYARPLVVRAIKKLLLSGCACVITEENAEWKYIDCVWNRMAIIDKGEMVAIGTVPELRQEYGAGYSATIKLKVDSAYGVVETVEDQNESEIDDTVSLHSYKYLVPVNNTNILKEEFLKIFDTSTLMDEHLSMLYFHIQDPGHSLLYSVMFEKLEGLKNKFSIIEDYTLSEVSVSEILSRLEKILHEKQKESSHMMKINMIGSDTPTPTTQSRAGSAASLTSISSRRQNPSPSQPQALSSQPQASSSQPQDPTSSQPQASSSQPQDPTSSQPQASSSQPRDPSSQPLDLTSQPRDPSSSSQPPDPSSSQPRDPSSPSQPPDPSSSQPRDPSS